ncbi:MAG: KEOPS complex subunit Cgi121 [Candidatus Sifarchaeia archaeon]|jgi:tRNA threonylcarbamoyladenosine modification (KEOPS) complex Cgi121 subunit
MNSKNVLIKSLEVNHLHFKFVGVTGFRDIKTFNIDKLLGKITRLGNEKNVTIQLFDSDLIATWEHLFFAALHGVKAFLYSHNISKSLAIESLIYASGQRQIKLALKVLGLKPKTKNCALLLVGTSPEEIESVAEEIYRALGGKLDLSVLDINESKFNRIQTTFAVSDIEIETLTLNNSWDERKTALVKLILERLSFLHF